MKKRIGKISITVLFVVVISLLVVNLALRPLSAVRIHSNETTKLGAFTGPVGDTAQDDNVKASLDLAHIDLDNIIANMGRIGLSTGEVYYVDSSAAGTADGLSWVNASTTVDAAIVLAGAASLADSATLILVAAGHAETLTAANQVDIDFSGFTVYGMGVGENRPTFTYTANGEFVIGADDAAIYNLNFVAGNATVHAIDVEAGFENYIIDNCRFWTTVVNTDEFIDCIDIAAGSDNGKITNCEFEIGAAAAVSAISHVGSDFTEISGNLFSGDFSTACIEDATTTSLWMIIDDNTVINGDTAGGLNAVAAISLKAETSAIITNNKVFCDMSRAGSIVAAAGYLSGNSYNGTIGSGTFLEVGKVYTLKKISAVSGTTDNLFDVTGGAIEIISCFGQITTIQAGDIGNISLNINATAGADYDADFSIVVAAANGNLGDIYTFGAITNAENAGVLQANENAGYPLSWFCPAGVIEQTTASTGTGAITWYITFRPLDEGVTVAASS